MTTVHIVGGGIAGLALAATLRRPDWDVVVHERSTGLDHQVGTAFGLWPAAMSALDRIGVGDAVRGRGVHTTTATIRDTRDRVMARLPEQDVVMIGRTALHDALRAALPTTVRWRDTGVEDTTSLTGDLIVGADGVHSVVRRDIWGSRSTARALPLTVIRGVIDEDLSRGEVAEYWGDGHIFGVTPVLPHSTNWFSAFAARPFDGADEGLRHLRRRCQGFPRQVQDTIAAARPRESLINAVHVSRRLSSVTRGRSVLIGDAAHAMTPSLGRGACEAIIDAVALGRCLNLQPPAEALRQYRRQRLVRPQLLGAASGLVTAVALSTGRRARCRDRLLGVLGRS